MKYLVRFFVALAALLVGAGSALADSEYGYNSAGTGVLTARSNLTVRVEVPKLVLLRVGAASSVNVATITAALTGGVIPGGAAPATGVNQTTSWDGTAPTFANASSTAVRAYAWTNASGNTTLSKSAAAFSAGGPALTDVTVSDVAVGPNGLAHPGGTLGAAATTTITRNTLFSSDWTFSILGTVIDTLAAGAYTSAVTYTATTL